MYLNRIALENFRTFRRAAIDVLHPDQDFAQLHLPAPRFPNVNVLLGNNGLGKSAFLRAVALAALGPAVSDVGIYPEGLIRREPGPVKSATGAAANVRAAFTPHEQDRTPKETK